MCCGLSTKQYLEKHPSASIYSKEWQKNSVSGENNPRYIDGRSKKKVNKEYKCKLCGAGTTGRGKTGLCFLCSIKYDRNSKSKLEIKIYEEISNIFSDAVSNKPIRNYIRGFLPDIILKPNVLLEVYGDYWHANPEIYASTDIMKRGLLAQDIWDSDLIRQQYLEEMGYIVKIIWEKDWKQNKEQILFDIRTSFDWDSCLF